MSSPADLLAAHVNGVASPESVVDPIVETPVLDSSVISGVPAAPPSITDEAAFPVLGGGVSKTNSGVNGGSAWSTRAVSPKFSVPAAASKLKPSTVQIAFTLEPDVQIPIIKGDLFDIINDIKKKTTAQIESTLSSNGKRNFLIRGTNANVELAKKMVVKKLTKPVKLEFEVPFKLRSAIIGAGGRSLNPIIESTGTRIDIANKPIEAVESTSTPEVEDEEDDIYGVKTKVTIDGDAEGVHSAKAKILEIVDSFTKNLSTNIAVKESLKAFLTKELASIVKNFSQLAINIPDEKSSFNRIRISGARDDVVEAKKQIKSAIETLESEITTQEVPIPKSKQHFIPVELILKELDVVVSLPTSSEAPVQFTGKADNIKKSLERARQETTKYLVESLDISKAHHGNVQHAKVIAKLFAGNGVLNAIEKENNTTIKTPIDLEDESSKTVLIDISGDKDAAASIKASKTAIVAAVNNYAPSLTKIVTDVDEFFVPQVKDTLASVSEEADVSVILLGKKTIALIANPQMTDDGFIDDAGIESRLTNVDSSLDELRTLGSSLETVILTVDSKKQADISGPNGTTLNLLYSGVPSNSVIIRLHSNKEGSSSDEVLVHGLKAQVSKIQKDIEEVLKEAEIRKVESAYTTTIQVPTKVLPRLIGKSGASMNELRDTFGVRIDVSDNDETRDAKDKPIKTEIVITGIKKNADACIEKINKLSKEWSDETLLRVKVESKFHGKLIGTGGKYLNRLQDKYNVKIRFPQEGKVNTHTDAPKSKDEVTIRGPSKGVAAAEKELKDLYDYEKQHGFSKTIKVPVKAISRLIGKNGETIKDIADGTGVAYTFDRNDENEKTTGVVDLEITGSTADLKAAEAKINEIITNIENTITVSIKVDPKYHRTIIGQNGSTMKSIIEAAGGPDDRRDWNRLLNIPKADASGEEITSTGDKNIVNKIVEQVKKLIGELESAVEEQYVLAKDKHRLLIGPGGSIRRNLQDDFKVSIDIPRANEDSTSIKLKGLQENVDKLKVKLDELTKDDWNVSIDVPEHLHGLVSERGALFRKLRTQFDVEVSHGSSARKAAKLSKTSIPQPPADAIGDEENKVKFTIVEDEPVGQDSVELIPWRLKGEDSSVKKASALINKALEESKKQSATGWFYAQEPSSVFNKLIGPQGSKIQKIRNSTGCFINIPRKGDKPDNLIYLRGTPESLGAAEQEFKKLIQ